MKLCSLCLLPMAVAAEVITDASPTFHRIANLSKTVQKVSFHHDTQHGRPVSWSDALSLLKTPRFQEQLTSILQESPFKAFYWECSPLSSATQERRPFEFVIIEGANLDRASPDTESFSEYLEGFKGQEVARAFTNLGGDSTLVAPAQATASPEDYKHFGAFIRRAPSAQHHAAWKTLGQEIEKRLEQNPQAPFWVSTEGSGVAWLHLRIDPRPKYYHHREYRSPEYGLDD
ncbi:unnamed protein product [Durusdinium trenchii]|uniref:Uncharacterized protein n=1 Tax=Durusdinium trenchii TaxID=1381693 RepID=A0ABP0P8E0_9DINO